MNRKNVDMLNGPITKGLFSLAIPIIVMNVLQSIFTIVDMTALRIFADDSAVGAVGVCGSIVTLCTSLILGIATGANVVVAKRIGEGNRERANRATMTALIFSVLSGLLLLLIGIFFGETFLRMVNCPEALLAKAKTYFIIYFCGMPIIMFYNFAANILRAIGDAKRPMYFLITSGVVKVVLTVILLLVTDMTVESVALATNIGMLVAAVLAFVTILRNKETISIDFKTVKFSFKELSEMLFIGIPTGLQTSLYSFANAVIASAVNSFGADATTGISIANQFDGIIYYVAFGPAMAATTYIAQNVGAKKIDRVKKAILSTLFITVLLSGICGSLFAIFSKQLASIMSETPVVIAYASQKMIIISSLYFIGGINEMLGGALRGMGRPIIPTIATLLFMCLIRFVWVYVFFPLCPNLTFLYAIWPIGWVLSISMLLCAFFPTFKKLQREALVAQETL